MQLPIVAAAERDIELVADFKANGSGLCKPQVMRVAVLPRDNQGETAFSS
jgi:hypothetical protein